MKRGVQERRSETALSSLAGSIFKNSNGLGHPLAALGLQETSEMPDTGLPDCDETECKARWRGASLRLHLGRKKRESDGTALMEGKRNEAVGKLTLEIEETLRR